MKFRFLVSALAFLFVGFTALAAPPPGYYLVWGDEFNGSSLNPTKWWVWNQPDRSGYSTPAAVSVGGGYMTILTYSTNGANYSGIVSSDGNFRARYGYTEASVEFNGSPGMFSDFWLNSANNGEFIGNPAASGAEIDVCEHRVTDANDADNISGNVTIDLHWNGYGSSEKSENSALLGSGLGTGFHTYGLLWGSTNYNVSIDGVPTLITNVGVSQRTEVIMFSSEVDSNSFCGIVPAGGYGDASVSATSTVVDYLRFYAPTTTLYWLGGSSANWTDTGNWLSNMIPTAATDAVFSFLTVGNYNINLDQPITVNSLSIQETPSLTIAGNALTVNGGGIDMVSALNNATINSALTLGAAQSWNIGSGLALIVNGAVTGSANLNLTGLGEVALEGTDNASGTTTVSSGALAVNGVLNGPVTVAGGTLTGTGILNGAVTVNSGALSGTETLTGVVIVKNGGTISPGSPTGVLTISNSLTLQTGSITLINLNKSAGTSGQIAGLSSIAFGGTLTITNLSGTLAPGDTFNVFSSANYSGAFTRISPATPGAGLAWDAAALATGTLRVISTSASNAVVTAQLAGQQLSLSWPLNNLGWQLEAQTNPPGMGITSNWVAVPGSTVTNVMNLTINPSVGSVFYRLGSSYSTAVFGNGDLLVLQVGNGSISSSGAPGFLNDYSTVGGAVALQVALPTTGANALVFGGSSYDGTLSLSADGHSVVVEGYNVAIGAFSGTIDSSSTSGSSPVRRAVGSVSANGTFVLNATTGQFSGSTIRSAVADGNGNYWAGGGASGIIYLGNNSSAATLSTVSTSTRDLGFVNGSIYFTETGSGVGVMAFSGAPTAGATPTLVISTAGTGSGTPSPKGFAINPGNIAYVCDNRTNSSGGGIQRFNWNGSAWAYAYTIPNTLTSSKEVEDLAVNFSGPNPILYAITAEATGNHLVKITDTGANSTYSSLEFAPSGDAFRGVAFAPH